MTCSRILVSILAAGLVSGLAGCGTGQAGMPGANRADEDAPVPVEATTPERADILATYEATATIGSEGDAPALARVPGEVVELLVEEGDRVQQGQVLARLDGERLRLEMLAAKADLDKARGEYGRYLDLNRRGLVSEAMFDGLRYELEALQSTWELRKLDHGYANIRAPISGYVSERRVKLGQTLKSGDEAFRITDTAELVAYLNIPQSELSKFAAGHAATLEVDSLPNVRFAAEIVRISPTIDVRNGTFRATAFIDNGAGRLAPGMFARFRIAYEKHSNALTIPLQALVREDDESSVYVVNDGAVARRRIETGIISDGRVEVLSGLLDNERVVVVGQQALRDGSKVLANLDDPEPSKG